MKKIIASLIAIIALIASANISFAQTQQDQNQLGAELTQKYGDGVIDIASGEFTKAE